MDLQTTLPMRSPSDAAAALWRDAGLHGAALPDLALPGREPVLASSFPVATCAAGQPGCCRAGRRRRSVPHAAGRGRP
jgi:hypothetical protein